MKPPLLAVAWLAIGLAGPVGAAPPTEQVFDAVKKPDAIDAAWRHKLCALLPQPCDPQGLGLYRPRGAAAAASGGEYVALSSAPLAMARVRRGVGTGAGVGGGAWQLDHLYDFSAYAQALQDARDESAPEQRLSLDAALYPLAEGKWAVAVLQTASEMYSGGGASFDTADFVPLEGGQAVREGIPFACNKMVRACFSQKEYKTSKHCHDESFGSLSIRYGAPASAGGPYTWRYTWLQHEWPQDTLAKATTTTRTRFTADTTSKADFCGGSQQ